MMFPSNIPCANRYDFRRTAFLQNRPGRAPIAGVHPGQQGFAIVLVLSFLALILVLVVAFFATTATELTSAKSYAQGGTAKQLGDSAVQMAMAAVRSATSTPRRPQYGSA